MLMSSPTAGRSAHGERRAPWREAVSPFGTRVDSKVGKLSRTLVLDALLPRGHRRVSLLQAMTIFSPSSVLTHSSSGCSDWSLFWRFEGREAEAVACVSSVYRGLAAALLPWTADKDGHHAPPVLCDCSDRQLALTQRDVLQDGDRLHPAALGRLEDAAYFRIGSTFTFTSWLCP